MIAALAALTPVFLLIVLAAALHRSGFLPQPAWDGMERATYFIFFPVFLFQSLADADFSGVQIWPLASAVLSGIAVMAVILPLARAPMRLGGAEYSSVYQGAIRWNSFVAIATVQGLYGPAGVTLATIAFAAIVPVVNMLSVYVLARHAGPGARASLVIKSVIANPLILSCLLGIGWQLLHLHMPGPIDGALRLLAEASISLGLFTVGAGLEFGHLKTRPGVMAVVTLLKLILMPVTMAAFCTLYNVTGPERGVAIVAGAVPTATNAYILARQLGGDAPLMAAIVSITTLAAFITMPLAIYFLA